MPGKGTYPSSTRRVGVAFGVGIGARGHPEMSCGVRETGADGHWAYVWMIASRTMPEFHRSGAPMSRMQNHARLEGQRGDPNAGIRVPVGPVTSSDFSLPCACTHAPGQKYTSSFFSTARSLVHHRFVISLSSNHGTGTHIYIYKVKSCF